MNNDKRIIEKQKEYISYLKRLCGIKSVSSDNFESELQVLESEAEPDKELTKSLLSSVIIKPTCISHHGGENEAYAAAMEILRKRYILFALGSKNKSFRIELHID